MEAGLYSVSFCFFLLLLLLLVLEELCSRTVPTTNFTTVRFLPGFNGPLPFELETGYVGVDDDDVQFFYYFIKSQRNPREDPLIFWNAGGPGCSGFFGIAFDIGPLRFNIAEYNGTLPTLVLNPNSWTKVSNIIFIDAPVGTGFSYSKSSHGSSTGDSKAAKQTYEFLRKWLIDHPEFHSNPLYIGGDSYAGMIVPVTIQHVSNGIKVRNEPMINLKGYVLGNPVTDYDSADNAKIPFAHGMGLISDELYESAKNSCGGEYVNVDPSNEQCVNDVDAVSECMAGFDPEYTLFPLCSVASAKPQYLIRRRRSLGNNLSKILLSAPAFPASLECRSYGYVLAHYWVNNDSVFKALNVRKGTVEEWFRCNPNLSYEYEVESTVNYHLTISKSYRSLIYSGDHDPTVPFMSTQEWIRSLNHSIIDDWRPWLVDGQVAGYTRTYSNNMTFATVKGAGHIALEYRPKECLPMFERWISHNPL